MDGLLTEKLLDTFDICLCNNYNETRNLIGHLHGKMLY